MLCMTKNRASKRNSSCTAWTGKSTHSTNPLHLTTIKKCNPNNYSKPPKRNKIGSSVCDGDFTNDDFRLGPTSTLINAGDNAAMFVYRFCGLEYHTVAVGNCITHVIQQLRTSYRFGGFWLAHVLELTQH